MFAKDNRVRGEPMAGFAANYWDSGGCCGFLVYLSGVAPPGDEGQEALQREDGALASERLHEPIYPSSNPPILPLSSLLVKSTALTNLVSINYTSQHSYHPSAYNPLLLNTALKIPVSVDDTDQRSHHFLSSDTIICSP